MSEPSLLYVHPAGHLNDLVVPAGALASLNAVARPKLGRYAFEVTRAEIGAARVVAIDLHWALGAGGFARLVRYVRAANPRAAIVAGGITAGIHARSLIDELGVDFVVRGDAERDFAALCGALLDGRDPGVLPNVIARDGTSGVPVRMTQPEFDATDCVTAAWFPTYDRVSNWDAAAYSMGRTIPALRGCPMRCAGCYGSYAQSMGEGHLVRSPPSLSREVSRAAAAGVRNLRLIMGKPPPPVLAAFFRGLAEAGPFRFPSTVGLLLCTPPSADDLDALQSAFQGDVALSVVPPDEHEPALGPERLRHEEERWRRVALRVDRSPKLRLDVWRTIGSDTRRARDVFVAGGGARVTVNLGAAWHMTRPRADGRPALADLRDLLDPLWTFYAARLLSPALASLLAPFRFLDDLDRDPGEIARPPDPLGRFHDVAQAGWRAHRLPFLPGLGFDVVPLRRGGRTTPLAREHAGVCFVGSAGARAGGPFEPTGDAPVPLHVEMDHCTVRLGSEPIPCAADGVAFVPSVRAAPDAAEVVANLPPETFGALVLEAPRPLAGLEVRVALRVQEADLALVDPSGIPVARARVHQRFFTPPPAGNARSGR